MARRSESPPSREDRYGSRGGKRRREDYDSGRDRNPRNYDSRERRRDYDSERSRWGYTERDRERERARDRERYERRREADEERREGGSSRQSERPARGSRRSSRSPRSRSGSRSKSPASKPNFAPSGLLAAETNTVKASDGTKTVLKYNEPPEARKPHLNWRLYVFKGSEQVELLHIHRQSAYLIGRDRLVADIPLEHPSSSKQHAVIQYRYVQEKNEFGETKGVVKPFIIDLESTNGTHVNDEAIPPARFYELKASDVIKFGTSGREYVLLHEDAA
ncbi:hypothetical protein AX16_008472 [Volvariella volvacea WC 439]|nr:hypothetical protein AX16_008472 [Volvariella volvacea WC 439]